jgi:hypothetical protein
MVAYQRLLEVTHKYPGGERPENSINIIIAYHRRPEFISASAVQNISILLILKVVRSMSFVV